MQLCFTSSVIGHASMSAWDEILSFSRKDKFSQSRWRNTRIYHIIAIFDLVSMLQRTAGSGIFYGFQHSSHLATSACLHACVPRRQLLPVSTLLPHTMQAGINVQMRSRATRSAGACRRDSAASFRRQVVIAFAPVGRCRTSYFGRQRRGRI
jgi:hypothetical protein